MIVQVYEIQTLHEAEKCIGLGVDHPGSVVLSEEDWRQPLLKDVMGMTGVTDAGNSLIPHFQRYGHLFEDRG